jgi:hypothetical protein
MTIHDRRMLTEAERKGRSAVSWRKILLLKRSALFAAWDRVFPGHDIVSLRLKRNESDDEFWRHWNAACDKAEREFREAQQPAPPLQHPTPQVTVEAIMLCVRERGIKALQEPDNIERLSRCDTAARQQINARIEKLR